MRISRVSTVAALLMALFTVSTSTASAATSPLGTTVTIGSAHLSPPSTHLSVTVAVDVNCSSSAFTTVFFEAIHVSVEQASAQGIAFGSGFVSGGPATPFPLVFPCNDATASVNVNVTAQPSGGPFHGGPALATANVLLHGADQFGSIHFDSVSEGPVTVRITGAEAAAQSPIA
jgi:hypothetical protein